MIVKDEAEVVRRCLASVKPHIDYWVICDTGSTDATQSIIKDLLREVPGELWEDVWVDFGHNRTLAMTRARGKADYLLLMNADEVLNVKADFKENLEGDGYYVRYEGDLDYALPLVVSAVHPWSFVGMTHEYLHASTKPQLRRISGVSVTHGFDGGSRLNKFGRDIMLLTRGLREEPENACYVFYLAQSYKDLGEYGRALELYQKRTEMGGWEEEVWYAGYQVGRMQQRLGQPWPVVLDSYLAAYQYRPSRLEPLFHVSKFYRETQQYYLGYLFSRAVIETPYPDDLLFIERSVYEYELLLEYGICCSWTGRHQEAIRVNEAILALPGVPPNFVETAKKNRQLSLEALSATRAT